MRSLPHPSSLEVWVLSFQSLEGRFSLPRGCQTGAPWLLHLLANPPPGTTPIHVPALFPVRSWLTGLTPAKASLGKGAPHSVTVLTVNCSVAGTQAPESWGLENVCLVRTFWAPSQHPVTHMCVAHICQPSA